MSRSRYGSLRQPKNCQRHAGLLGKQQDLFGSQFAPWVAKQTDWKRFLHAGEVRLHLVVDAAVLEFAGECKKVLWKHGHGRGKEQVLEALAQTQFEHVVQAERIELAYGVIGSSETYIGSKMVDRINPLA